MRRAAAITWVRRRIGGRSACRGDGECGKLLLQAMSLAIAATDLGGIVGNNSLEGGAAILADVLKNRHDWFDYPPVR